jgi:NADH-quinone oxidoreductase subunit J
MVLTIIVLALMLIAALWTVMTRGLVRAALGLAVTSIILTVLMFMLGAGLAAVFELSVCAGLITVVFVSTIAMTQPSSKSELLEKTRHRMRRYWFLPVIIVAVGAVLAWLSIGATVSLPVPDAADATSGLDVKQVLWGLRQTDLVGQVIVILAGVFGVIVLFKERKT